MCVVVAFIKKMSQVKKRLFSDLIEEDEQQCIMTRQLEIVDDQVEIYLPADQQQEEEEEGQHNLIAKKKQKLANPLPLPAQHPPQQPQQPNCSSQSLQAAAFIQQEQLSKNHIFKMIFPRQWKSLYSLLHSLLPKSYWQKHFTRQILQAEEVEESIEKERDLEENFALSQVDPLLLAPKKYEETFFYFLTRSMICVPTAELIPKNIDESFLTRDFSQQEILEQVISSLLKKQQAEKKGNHHVLTFGYNLVCVVSLFVVFFN